MQVGELAGGLAAAEWSPDGELLSLVSGRGQLLLMNKVAAGGQGLCTWRSQPRTVHGIVAAAQVWEVIAETWLFATDEHPVPSRPLTAESLPEEVSLGPADVRITWRGDGKFFATCSRPSAGEPAPAPCGLLQLSCCHPQKRLTHGNAAQTGRG